MHELHLLKDILDKIAAIAAEQQAKRVSKVSIWLGALSHISAEHFKEHFVQATQGHVARDAALDIEVSTDEAHEQAQEIILKSVELDAG